MKIVPLKIFTQAKWLRRVMNVWPPFVGAGIHVTRIDDDYRAAQVRMTLRFYNRNYLGTHYGGSLYSMTDAFYAIMIIRNLDPHYYVWDKSAEIDYIAPAKNKAYANYRLDDATLDTIRTNTANGEKYLHNIDVDIVDEKNTLVARVTKVIYIRLKPEHR